MTHTDWSREIAALTPFLGGTTLELAGPAPGLLPGTTPLAGWDAHADGGADAIVALGAPEALPDPVAEIRQWRRVLREGGTLALIVRQPGTPTWLTSLLHLVGGLDVTSVRAIRPGATWLVVAERRALAEVRCPLGTLGPHLAAAASHEPDCLAELYFQFGTILLQAGDPELAQQCFASLQEVEGHTADGLFGLGMCRGSLGQWSEAAADLRRARELAPHDAEIGRWLLLAEERLQGAQTPARPPEPVATSRA